MEDKKCYTCGSFKDRKEFNKNKSKKDGLNTICKSCSKIRFKRYYEEHKEEHIHNVSKRKNKDRILFREYIGQIKSSGCVCCGEKEKAALDFHHLRDKKFSICKSFGNVNLEDLTEEINKCIILCANCHRKFHAGIIKLPPNIEAIKAQKFTSKIYKSL